MIITREQAIEFLLTRVEEVVGNGDWPTEEGRFTDDGMQCSCFIQDLVNHIRKGD